MSSQPEGQGHAQVTDRSSSPVGGTKVLDTQVGGHRYGKNGVKMGMLDRGNGMVLKALQNPPRGTRELDLYQTTFAPACCDKHLLELRNFLPLYYGTEVLDDATFLVMDNIAHSFTKPNVLDLKMGRVTYDPEATEEKKTHEVAKYPPLKDLGFQLTGMMIHNTATDKVERFTKDFCRSVTAESMLTEGLGRFFGLQSGRLRKDVITALLPKLRQIEDWFHVQRKYAFYASSLLIVYGSEDPGHTSPTPPLPLKSAGSGSSAGSSVDRKVDNGEVKPLNLETGSGPNGAEHKHPGSESSTIGNTSTGSESKSEEKTSTGSEPSRDENKRAGTESVKGENAHTGTGVESSPQTGKKRARSPDSDPKSSDSQAGPSRKLFRTSLEKTQSPWGDVNVKKLRSDPPTVEVRMIDFAHVFPATGKDDNYLFGLQKLISFLERLLQW